MKVASEPSRRATKVNFMSPHKSVLASLARRLGLWQELRRIRFACPWPRPKLDIRAPALPRRWETMAAGLCLAQFSEPLFAAIAQSQGLAEPPGYARIFFLQCTLFLAGRFGVTEQSLGVRRSAAPLLIALVALTVASAFWSIEAVRRCVVPCGCYCRWRSGSIWRGAINERRLSEVLGFVLS